MLTYGVAVLARPTFDVPFAEATKERAFAALEAAGIRTVGPRGLLFDRAAAEQAVAEIGRGADCFEGAPFAFSMEGEP